MIVLFLGLYFEGGISAVSAKQALTHETWGLLFWFCVVVIGLITPIIIAGTALKNHAYRPVFIVLDSFAIITGVVCLRYFFVYAGQTCLGI